jgi:Ca2+-binding RTX toxin-like protein
MPTQLFTYSFGDVDGTANDDFLLNLGADSTITGGDGDDYILGDSSNLFFLGTSDSFAAPANIDDPNVWTVDENPFFVNSTIPHQTLYVHPSAGETLYSSVTIGAGQTITVDIDFGNGNPIGVNTDVVVTIFNSSGVQVATNDDGNVTFLTGDEGSTNTWDSMLTFTAGSADTYTIRFSEFGGTFEGDETFVANISVTGHTVGTPTTMGNDTLIGGNGDDTMAGQGGDDSLSGGLGDDTLIGGSGNDLLNGGGGLDRASYAGASSGVIVDLNATGDQDTGGAGTDRLISVEQLSGSSFNDFLIGDGNANLLTGAAGDDTLIGGGGVDQIYGGVGNDTLNGDDGDDTVLGEDGDDHVFGGAGNDQVLGGTGNDLVSGGAGNDTMFGGTGDDVLFGDDGNDFLAGDAANDQLRGGAGNDTLRGGTGNDVLDGGAGRDLANYEDVTAVTVNLSLTGDQDTIGGGIDRLSSIEDVSGSGFDDTLTGNAGGNILRGMNGNDTLDGGANNDVLEGGLGDDSIEGGAGQDTATYENAGSAVTVDLNIVGAQNTNGAGLDTLSGIERLRGSAFDDTLTGDGNANVLWGGLGADTLSGGLGNDRLFGDDGNDILIGGDGADRLDGGNGDDSLDGGIGNDTLYDTRGTNTMNGGEGDDEITSGGGNDTLSGGGGDDLIFGANGDDTIIGNDGNDHLRGGNGDDSLTGGAGADRLVGGNNNDTLDGGTQDDLLFGDAGQDVLFGGDGNDNLFGGANGDTLTGGAGADRFRLDSDVGADTITDFSVPDDTIMLDAAVFTAFSSNGTLGASMFRAGTAAVDSNDHIIYNSANGRVFYDADGSGAGAQVLIATVTPGTALTSADFVIYNAGSAQSPLAMATESVKPFQAMEMHHLLAHEMLI